MKHAMITTALLCAALAVGTGAQAKDKNNGKGQNNGPTVGNAGAEDVTLASAAADAFAFSTVNPMQHGGNAAGFAGTFATPAAGAWNVLGTVTGAGKLTDSSGLLDFSFAKTGATTGTWTVTNMSATKNVTIDLALAIHASNASSAFLFDDQAVAAGQTLSGTWRIDWLNNGGQVPGFSNAVFFGGDMSTSNVTLLPVPEPHGLPMVLAGFAVLGAAAWRRRGKTAA